jgi:DNA-binding NtrC family response regulator
LAAVLGIVRSHYGGLRVESEVGKGTTFTLYFPVSAAHQPTTPTITDREQSPVATQGLVLVIDDEEPVREAVMDILEIQGIMVITARDGRAGLTLYRERQADVGLVLLDLSMPGLSGEETFHELRRINPSVSIILSSGYQQSEVTRRFAGQGLVGFLQKPYDVDTLIREVGRHLA